MSSSQIQSVIDCLIVGGGPAGLTAAIYLARYRRSLRIIDAGESRALRIPLSHNYPGFPDGVVGADLMQRLTAQAARYGVTVESGHVEAVRHTEGKFLGSLGGPTVIARTVLLATGVVDNQSNLPDLQQSRFRDTVRWCPICDGYEVMGQHVALVSDHEACIEHALFIRAYTQHLTVILNRADAVVSANTAAALQAHQIALIVKPIAAIDLVDGKLSIGFGDGQELSVDVLYPTFGSTPRSDIAIALGARTDNEGALLVDPHQSTSVPGLYAAGDIVKALNQMTVGMSHATIAATAIHNRLRDESERAL